MLETDKAIIKQIIFITERIIEYTDPYFDPDAFVTDYKTYDATLMNFIALGEAVGKLSEGIKINFPKIEWRKIYAFRNVLAHNYFGIDEEEVLEIARHYIPELRGSIQKIVDQIGES